MRGVLRAPTTYAVVHNPAVRRDRRSCFCSPFIKNISSTVFEFHVFVGISCTTTRLLVTSGISFRLSLAKPTDIG